MLTLQNIIFPELEICSEQELYMRLDGHSAFDQRSNTLHFSLGGHAFFDTYFNALSLRKWNCDGQLDDLFVSVQGQGAFEIRVFHALPERSWELVTSEVVDLHEGQPSMCDLTSALSDPDQGLLFVQVKALGAANLTALSFMTNTAPVAWPDLTVSITTFKRETEVERTVQRLQDFLEDYEHAENIKVVVVDNGQSANITPSEYVSYFPNDNLGGAGGFARGLLEAESKGSSHVLFTDDDAAFSMESLHRTFMFLALAKDSKTAVAGAMINNTHKWAMWENGAVFDSHCKPLSVGQDLRSMQKVFEMETFSADFKSPNMYGGWWFFAFPIEHAKFHPFPFFVRGDDISFSLANDFNIRTLNGVVSFQDDFSEKESPMTIYLDVRNHIVQHLTLPHMKIGNLATALIPIQFACRNLVRFQYETMEACLLAWEDVMSGPAFFRENKDMAERRNYLKGIIKNEVFKPADGKLPDDWIDIHQKMSKPKFWWRRATMNGHLFPIRRNKPANVKVTPADRTNLFMVWGQKSLTYLAPGRKKSYTVRFDRLRGLKLLFRLLKNYQRFARNYEMLIGHYQAAYPQTASREFWQEVYASKESLETDQSAT